MEQQQFASVTVGCSQNALRGRSNAKSVAALLSHMQDPESETARKKAEADRLRAAEKFMVIGSGTAQCKGCGYEYSPEKGDPDFPVPKGVRFQVSSFPVAPCIYSLPAVCCYV
jgi:hypothetical protein